MPVAVIEGSATFSATLNPVGEGQPVAATVQAQPVVRGDTPTWTFTLSGSGSISGAAVTADVRRRGSPQPLLSAVALSILDVTNRTVTFAPTAAQTNLFVGNANDPVQLVEHVLDVTMVLAGVTTTFGPFVFFVRTRA